MLILECNQPTFFDIDDTLIQWGFSDKPFEGSVEVRCQGIVNHVLPHKAHIHALKSHRARGHTIIVWSKGGSKWGEAAVKALGLEEFVDLVIEKPQWVYDDAEYDSFMPKILFLEDKK